MVITLMSKSYSELITYDTFEDRFNYLKIGGQIGHETFGFDRYLNQAFYKSREWKLTRNKVILRDNACDLGVPGHEIFESGRIRIHHMIPITMEMVINRDPIIFDTEFLITTILRTHNAIHYGDESLISKDPVVRRVNDTCPWK